VSDTKKTDNGGARTVKSVLEEQRVKLTKHVIRDTERGKLVVNFAAIRVRRSHHNMPIPGECWLLIREELDGSDVKFSFSNAPATTNIETLAEWQSRRYWVEQALQDAKG
jgi:hypothetical protein